MKSITVRMNPLQKFIKEEILTDIRNRKKDLDTLGTHPDYQRRGAGSMLVKWGCDLADKDGVAAYVDASKEGAPLYQKHGFVDFNPPDADVAAMARPKATPSDRT